MTIAASATTMQDINSRKYKWTACGSTVAGSTIGDWAYVGDADQLTALASGSFASTLTWQGSINGNTSDAVAFTLHNSTGAAWATTAALAQPVAERVEYIRPITGAGSSATSIDAYLFLRSIPS